MSNPGSNYDVIVVGGGSGGVGAAVGSAQEGARTLLIEAAGCLGGAASLRNVLTYCGVYTLGETPRRVVGGVAETVLDRLRDRGGVSGPHRFRGVFLVFDPETNKLVLDEVCEEAGVEILFHSRLASARRDENQIASIDVQDHGGVRTLTATAFIDATGEADLAHLADASVRYGNDGAVNLASLGTRFGGVPADVEITAQMVAAAVEDRQAAGVDVFTKKSSVVTRLPISGDLCMYVASADYDPRDAASMSRAERSGRRQAQAYLAAIRGIEGAEHAYLVSTGPEFGTRESRHIDSVRRLCWADIEARRRFEDSVALGAWGAEWHDRTNYQSTLDLPPEGEPYEIPLRCLMSADTANLFAAGRTADGDRKAGAAIRVMGTAFVTGQAAGVAAAQLSGSGVVDPNLVRASLRAQNAMLDTDESSG